MHAKLIVNLKYLQILFIPRKLISIKQVYGTPYEIKLITIVTISIKNYYLN